MYRATWEGQKYHIKSYHTRLTVTCSASAVWRIPEVAIWFVFAWQHHFYSHGFHITISAKINTIGSIGRSSNIFHWIRTLFVILDAFFANYIGPSHISTCQFNSTKLFILMMLFYSFLSTPKLVSYWIGCDRFWRIFSRFCFPSGFSLPFRKPITNSHLNLILDHNHHNECMTSWNSARNK